MYDDQQPDSNIAQILKFALPALAAGYSFSRGTGFGSFGQGMLQGRDQMSYEQDRQEQRKYRQDMLNRQIADEATRRAHEERLEAAAGERTTLERQRLEAERMRGLQGVIQKALEDAAQNPAFLSKLNEVGPESFSITVPGLGPIPLKDAMEKYGAGLLKGPDGYMATGRPPTPPAPEPLEDVVDTTAPGGHVLTPRSKAAGKQKYYKPEKPPKEPKTTTRAYNWRDDDPDSETVGQTFRIIEDENGNQISKRRLTAGEEGPKPMPSHAPTPPSGGGFKVGRFLVQPG